MKGALDRAEEMSGSRAGGVWTEWDRVRMLMGEDGTLPGVDPQWGMALGLWKHRTEQEGEEESSDGTDDENPSRAGGRPKGRPKAKPGKAKGKDLDYAPALKRGGGYD